MNLSFRILSLVRPKGTHTHANTYKGPAHGWHISLSATKCVYNTHALFLFCSFTFSAQLDTSFHIPRSNWPYSISSFSLSSFSHIHSAHCVTHVRTLTFAIVIYSYGPHAAHSVVITTEEWQELPRLLKFCRSRSFRCQKWNAWRTNVRGQNNIESQQKWISTTTRPIWPIDRPDHIHFQLKSQSLMHSLTLTYTNKSYKYHAWSQSDQISKQWLGRHRIDCIT